MWQSNAVLGLTVSFGTLACTSLLIALLMHRNTLWSSSKTLRRWCWRCNSRRQKNTHRASSEQGAFANAVEEEDEIVSVIRTPMTTTTSSSGVKTSIAGVGDGGGGGVESRRASAVFW
jgi:hypothetical protein